MITNYTQNISAIGSIRQGIPYLSEIDEFSYESFFRTYLTKDNQFFYNLLSVNVGFEGVLDTNTYYNITVTRKVPWTTISYNEYQNMNLWWLIVAVNDIRNPVEYPKPGTVLKILYPKYVRYVIDNIKEKI